MGAPSWRTSDQLSAAAFFGLQGWLANALSQLGKHGRVPPLLLDRSFLPSAAAWSLLNLLVSRQEARICRLLLVVQEPCWPESLACAYSASCSFWRSANAEHGRGALASDAPLSHVRCAR